MRYLALIVLCGCSQIFGLNSPAHGTVIDAMIDSPGSDGPPQGCTTIADCPTSVCLPDGTCAADGDVAWLDPAGISNGTCSKASPCPKLNDGLNTQRPYIRVHGALNNVTNINRSVIIFGEPGASVGQPGYNITVNAGTVGIYDLTFAMSCITAASPMPLTLVDDTISACNNYGLSVNGPIVVDRCSILGNRSGGVRINSTSPFVLTNNVIAGNDTMNMNDTGGVNITSTTIGAGSRLDFNTIVDNNVKNATTTAGGVTCDVAGFTASSNIIAHNTVQGSTIATNANTVGQCMHASSIIEADDTNLNLSTGTYRLGAGSIAIDAAMTPPIIDHDIDGDHRPQGTAYDIGADEYP